MRRRWLARVAAGFAALVALLGCAVLATDLPRDPAIYPPAPGAPVVEVIVVSNGFHTGLVIPRAPLAEVADRTGETALAQVSARFGAYPTLEFGWGEEEFYRLTPTLASARASVAFRALFLANRTVLHVVGLGEPAWASFPHDDLVPIPLSPEGFERLTRVLEDTFARDDDGGAIDVGPGLYGPSRFFRATGRTSVLNVCNTWVGRLLNAAGLANAPLVSVFAAGLVADLELRSGVTPLPR